MTDHILHDCLIIGGGIAGLQAAIQLGRYRHRVMVVDKGIGRSTLCRRYHNLLGWPDGVSGEKLRQIGRQQAEAMGVSFLAGEAVRASQEEDGQFEVELRSGKRLRAKKLLLATGVLDRYPPLPGLEPCLGLTVYVCPDCDGYEVMDQWTIVIGSGTTGAEMALMLRYWTDRIVYVNHEQKPIPGRLVQELITNKIEIIEEAITSVLTEEDGVLRGVALADGRMIEADRGFIAFGGNAVYSELAQQLGAERLENRHIVTNPRTMETSVQGLYAAGDIAVHAEQVTMAMGEGSLAAIWMHKSLLTAGSE